MLGYFIQLLPFSICYGYTMQMIMRRNKNQLLDTVTYLIAGLGIYFLCYSYECNPESSPLALLVTDLLSQWITPMIVPLSLAIMNGLKRRKMFSDDVVIWFLPGIILGVAGTIVHLTDMDEKWHILICRKAFNIVIAIEMLYIFISNFTKMGGKDFAWHRLLTFFTKNSASRPLMVIGVSINVFILLISSRLIVGPESFYEYYYIGLCRSLIISFVLLLLCNTLVQANTPWITLKSLFDPNIQLTQSDDEEEEELAKAMQEGELKGELPSEISLMTPTESSQVLDRIDQLASELRKYMEEDMAYLQPDISIDKVSAKLGTNRFYISRLVNVEQSMSFRDYVNSLRIEHAKVFMSAHPEATQEQIAEECGFSSASYFNRKFKQITGRSPQDWRNN